MLSNKEENNSQPHKNIEDSIFTIKPPHLNEKISWVNPFSSIGSTFQKPLILKKPNQQDMADVNISISKIYYGPYGDKYEGQLKNGKFQGKGIYYDPYGGKYDGQWKDGSKNGKGLQYNFNGDRYDGQFKNGLKQGVTTQMVIVLMAFGIKERRRKEFFIILRVANMKVILKMIDFMEEASTILLEETFIQANLNTTISMERECIPSKMDKVTKANLKEMIFKEEECSIIMMGALMKEIGKMISKMEKVSQILEMEVYIKDSFRMVNLKERVCLKFQMGSLRRIQDQVEENQLTEMAANTLESGETIRNKVEEFNISQMEIFMKDSGKMD